MFTSTVARVPRHTADHVNLQIQRATEESIRQCGVAGVPAIDARLAELEREWDVERTLEANAATAVLAGVLLGAAVDRRWFAFPAIVGGFLLQHALQGWCPPMAWFRRLGIRTSYEIDYERYALKALRGDFERLPDATSAQAPHVALAAAKR